ncbi:MAG: complex I NDUFA9 subunit family protein [Pseudomonadota bacterium]
MEIKNVCVLGGSGFVGRHIVHQLSERGINVRVLTRSYESGKHLTVLPGMSLVRANVHDPADLRRQFEGMDAVINLVGILHERKAGDFEKNHVELPRKVVEACLAAGVRRLLHMSAQGADPNGLSRYQRTKGQGEALVLQAGNDRLKVTVFRPSVIFGREDTFLNMFANVLKWSPVFPLGSPNAKLQPVFVDDVARAYVASLSNPATFGHRYELCGPKVYTLRELVEFVAKTRGYCRVILCLNDRLSYLQAWVFEKLPVKILTRDNYYSLKTDNVCPNEFPAVFGFRPTALEVVAPQYLAGNDTDRYRDIRRRAGR